MTLRRVAALAQALALIVILLPGLEPGGPAQVQAALAPSEPDALVSFDAADNGVGCQTSGRKFRGPRLPKNPPWPPGAKPTPRPTPVPSPVPSADPALDAGGDPAEGDEPVAAGATMLLTGTGVLVAQADPTVAPIVQEPETEAEHDARTAPKEKKKLGLLPGIDVSHWQNRVDNSDIDFERVRAGGNRFVIIKATESIDHLDTWFDRNIAGARAAGLVVGGYHAFDYTIDGTAQADHFIDRLEEENGLVGALPPAVDVECWSYRGASTQVIAAGRLRDFVEQVYRRTGRLPILYTSARAWEQVVGNAKGFERLPLWAVCWRCQPPPTLADGWDGWTFWQTGTRRIPGRPDKVDGNYFVGSRKDLKALKLRPFAIERGAEATRTQRVELDLGGRNANALRTSPDGEQWSQWRPVRNKARAELHDADEGEQMLYVQLRAGPGLRSPVLSDAITLDLSGPEMSKPSVSLRAGAIGSGGGNVPVTVSWTAQDALAGLSDATVSVSCGEGQNQRTEAPGSGVPGESVAWSGEAALLRDAECTVTAIARDGVGNTARNSLRGVEATVLPVRGDAPSAAVAGAQAGIIAMRGPDRGRAEILLDGEAVGVVDLYAPVASGPEIVFVAELVSGALHNIVVEGTGTSDPASTGAGISIDGFVTLSGSTRTS